MQANSCLANMQKRTVGRKIASITLLNVWAGLYLLFYSTSQFFFSYRPLPHMAFLHVGYTIPEIGLQPASFFFAQSWPITLSAMVPTPHGFFPGRFHDHQYSLFAHQRESTPSLGKVQCLQLLVFLWLKGTLLLPTVKKLAGSKSMFT